MVNTLVGALALASLPSALAFRNTSPFFLFSTSRLSVNGNDVGIAQSGTITEQVKDTLRDCPSRAYILVRQDGVSSADYLDGDAMRLGQYLSGESALVKSINTVSEVVGVVDADAISKQLQTNCGAQVVRIDSAEFQDGQMLTKTLAKASQPQDATPQVMEITLAAPPAHDRATALDNYGSQLYYAISNIATSLDYTVIYTTTPQTEAQAKATEKEHTYEMEYTFGDAVQMELKRDMSSQRRANAKKEGGNFEKYQYFSPGIFMGISATIPLFLILFVGLRSIASLEVSYFAFSKEMGPTAQRKQ